jgi:predicted  nucleic acid-binding Zn-ribbon protein
MSEELQRMVEARRAWEEKVAELERQRDNLKVEVEKLRERLATIKLQSQASSLEKEIYDLESTKAALETELASVEGVAVLAKAE